MIIINHFLVRIEELISVKNLFEGFHDERSSIKQNVFMVGALSLGLAPQIVFCLQSMNIIKISRVENLFLFVILLAALVWALLITHDINKLHLKVYNTKYAVQYNLPIEKKWSKKLHEPVATNVFLEFCVNNDINKEQLQVILEHGKAKLLSKYSIKSFGLFIPILIGFLISLSSLKPDLSWIDVKKPLIYIGFLFAFFIQWELILLYMPINDYRNTKQLVIYVISNVLATQAK